MKNPSVRCLALTALVLGLVGLLAIPASDILERLEDRIYDYRMRISPRPEGLPDIVHVDIDDSSTRKLGTWPFSRSVHAEVLDVLTDCGADLVVYDLIFHGVRDEADDAALEAAIKRNGRVLLPAGFQLAQEEDIIRLEVEKDDLPLLGSLMRVKPPNFTDLLQVERSFMPLDRFSRHALGIGHVSATPDTDGVFRRFPLVIGFNGRPLPSIDLLAAMNRVQADNSEWHGSDFRITGKEQDSVRDIPVDPMSMMMFNYAGLWGQDFEHIPYHHVYQAAKDPEKLPFLKQILENKIVFIGLTTTGGTDLGPTPLGPSQPLVTVHSNAINTILTGAFITKVSTTSVVVITLLLILAIGLLWRFLPPKWFIPSAFLLLALYGLGNFALFRWWYIALNFGGVLTFGTAAFLSLLGWSYLHTATEHAKQRRVLETYFSPGVSKELLKSTSDPFEGSNQDLTVFFSDIAGFTSLSDQLQPVVVQRLLREYFEAMTDIIFKYGGAIDKFMGDGIMAFWGFPKPDDLSTGDNARKSAMEAVRAAVEMQQKMIELNQKWKDEGREQLQIRIGINTGFVTVGNMGSESRLEFTLLGKNVNMAQRLESNAPVGGVLVSKRTNDLIKDIIRTKDMGEIHMKGFEKPVKVFSVSI